jgi:DNA helicase-2/ATP-dependent DNA helicase PcrA
VDIIEDVRAKKDIALDELYDYLLNRSGYISMLEAKDIQENNKGRERKRIKTNIVSFLKEEAATEALKNSWMKWHYTAIWITQIKTATVFSLMTMHSAKGLEFPIVFIAGAEEGIFPGLRAIGEPDEIEEERRLCYVAITRAKCKLYITNARQRAWFFGKTQNNCPHALYLIYPMSI